MAKSFSASVSQWVGESKEITEAAYKESVQRIAIDANTPVAQGGRMRVDTSFLRNSQAAQLNRPPVGPSDPDTDPQGNPSDVALTIARASLRDTIWIGWTAGYASAREYKDGFAKAAAQRWRATVRKVAAELRARTR